MLCKSFTQIEEYNINRYAGLEVCAGKLGFDSYSRKPSFIPVLLLLLLLLVKVDGIAVNGGGNCGDCWYSK